MVIPISLEKQKVLSRVENSYIFNQQKPLYTECNKRIYLACGCKILVYNFRSRSLQRILEGHKSKVIAIRVDPYDEETIISCDENGMTISWAEDDANAKISHFKSPKESLRHVVYFDIGPQLTYLLGFKDGDHMSLYCYKNEVTDAMLIFLHLDLGSNKVCVNRNYDYIVGLTKKRLLVYKYKNFSANCVKTKLFKYTLTIPPNCITCHPNDDAVAIGDKLGAIYICRGLTERSLAKEKMHWHTLPVTDLCFSESGANLYSGGEECVVVCWILNKNSKKVLARLGMPVSYITVAEEFLVSLHIDNDVTLINGLEHSVVGKLDSQLVYCHPATTKSPVGLLTDNKNGSIITNGMIGYLQFYDPQLKKRRFNMDITLSNYLCRERFTVLSNPSVEKADVSSDGQWLATYHECSLNEDITDRNLRFWEYVSEEKGWMFNVSVNLPHTDRVNAIAFCPVSNERRDRYCITMGQEGNCKFWKLIKYDAGKEYLEKWECFDSETYRNTPCTAGAFSNDGSMVAIGFGPYLTVWKLGQTQKFLGTLFHSLFKEEIIRDIAFSKAVKEDCYIFVRTDRYLLSWNTLKCTLEYFVELSSTCMAVDPLSGVVAVFSPQHKKAYFYRPLSKEPITSCDLDDNEVLHAVFISNGKFAEDFYPWQSQSHLYYMNGDQVICTLEFKEPCESIETPISRLVAEESSHHGTAVANYMAKSSFLSAVPAAKPVEANLLTLTDLADGDTNYFRVLFKNEDKLLAPPKFKLTKKQKKIVERQSPHKIEKRSLPPEFVTPTVKKLKKIAAFVTEI